MVHFAPPPLLLMWLAILTGSCVHRIFPRGGGENAKWKVLVHAKRALFFCNPWDIFAIPQGGARFSQRGAKILKKVTKPPKKNLGKFSLNIGRQGLRPPWTSSAVGDAPPLGCPGGGKTPGGGLRHFCPSPCARHCLQVFSSIKKSASTDASYSYCYSYWQWYELERKSLISEF